MYWRGESVGSANLDYRSFRLNDESNLNILDPRIAEHELKQFEEDLKRSKRITYEEWRTRPLPEKLRDHAAALLRSQL